MLHERNKCGCHDKHGVCQTVPGAAIAHLVSLLCQHCAKVFGCACWEDFSIALAVYTLRGCCKAPPANRQSQICLRGSRAAGWGRDVLQQSELAQENGVNLTT